MSDKPRWLLLTVGAGSPNFENAADRLVSDSLNFNLFDSVVSLKTAALIALLCPAFGANLMEFVF
jgi:hypothetical protein